METDEYSLLDSGGGRKLEQFGAVTLDRPGAAAYWPVRHPERWKAACARFDRAEGMEWKSAGGLPAAWYASIGGIEFRLSTTDFGHLGVFPEQRPVWAWVRRLVGMRRAAGERCRVLNLFAYSGGCTLAAAQAGAEVCHLDASHGMVEWARANAARNGLQDAPIRWIVDDVLKFLQREARRDSRYDAVILDPPSFGRGRKGEVFKIEQHIGPLLDACAAVLVARPLFVLMSCHTPEFSPIVLGNLLLSHFPAAAGTAACGELVLTGAEDVLPLPSGVWACRSQSGDVPGSAGIKTQSILG